MREVKNMLAGASSSVVVLSPLSLQLPEPSKVFVVEESVTVQGFEDDELSLDSPVKDGVCRSDWLDISCSNSSLFAELIESQSSASD
jgi:hypothetical protein